MSEYYIQRLSAWIIINNPGIYFITSYNLIEARVLLIIQKINLSLPLLYKMSILR